MTMQVMLITAAEKGPIVAPQIAQYRLIVRKKSGFSLYKIIGLKFRRVNGIIENELLP
ncbi:MAG: hypothetical protein QM500_20660 [Methylococcales bacterium]